MRSVVGQGCGFLLNQINVRVGKGSMDWVTMLPQTLIDPLRLQLAQAKALHDADLAVGMWADWLPDALAVKYPNASKAWGWQYVFPESGFSIDPRSGTRRRHLVDEKMLQRHMQKRLWLPEFPNRSVRIHSEFLIPAAF